MKLFISWSGEISHRAALILRDWLPSVIQAIEPYVSSEDIDKGTRWGQDLGEALDSLSVGVICLTSENVTAPWINFEAGALSKSLDNSRVMPLMLGITQSQVPWPLAQFQLTSYEKDDVRRMVSSINGRCDPAPCVTEALLNRSFDRWWPDLKENLDPLVVEAKNVGKGAGLVAPPNPAAIMEELLELTRDQHRMLASQGRSLSDKELDRIASRLDQSMINGSVTRRIEIENRLAFHLIQKNVNELALAADRDVLDKEEVLVSLSEMRSVLNAVQSPRRVPDADWQNLQKALSDWISVDGEKE